MIAPLFSAEQWINEQSTRFLNGASSSCRGAGDPKQELRQVEHLPLGLRQQEQALRREGDLPESRGQARTPMEQRASGERRASVVVVFQA